MNTIQLTDNINTIYPLPEIPKKIERIDGYEYEEPDFETKEGLIHRLCGGSEFFKIGEDEQPRFTVNELETIIAHRYKYFVKMRKGNFVVCANAELRKVFKAVAEWLINPQGKSSLLLNGRTGSGKSTMLRVLQSILWKPYFCTSYNIAHIDYQHECDLPISQSSVLIDDLGTEELKNNSYGMPFCPMIELLTKRYDSQAQTIITSNLTIEHIADRYGERIADRIREEYKIIGFNIESYRGLTELIPDKDDNIDRFVRTWE